MSIFQTFIPIKHYYSTFEVEHVAEEQVPNVLHPHILLLNRLSLKCKCLPLLVELEACGVTVNILSQTIVTCLIRIETYVSLPQLKTMPEPTYV